MTQTAPRHAINWFEIPVRNLGRAQQFYETVLAAPLRREDMGGSTMAVFGYDDGGGVGGCLVEGAPAAQGTLVYLNAAPSLDAALARVQAAGGRIATPRTELPGDMGAFAHIVDTEGNRIGLHA
ncbi:VOC family protein [Piscinibacter sp. XHJ-5]|uniref:VOC family protein n=1 Tax=Piscinibacter sp. XHJ-5 TaxID=3037797 RepID=UPI002452820B|nr:VOC family protein [Piscinibacter sp. XHJ-5]